MSKIVLRGGPHCGEEFRARNLPETWRVPLSPATGPLEPSPDPYMVVVPTTVDYRRTGRWSESGAHIYDWTGLNWGAGGAMVPVAA